jgi:hypothetical protein
LPLLNKVSARLRKEQAVERDRDAQINNKLTRC